MAAVLPTAGSTRGSWNDRRRLRSLRRVALAVALGFRLGCATGVHAAPPASADSASISAAVTPTGGRITVEAQGVQPTVPVFFTATVDATMAVAPAEIVGEARLALRVIQGQPEVLTLGLRGDGEVTAVTGAGLKDWAVRQGTGASAGRRFLDLRPLPATGNAPLNLELTVRMQQREPAIPGKTAMLLLTAGDAVALDWHARIQPDAAVDVSVAQANGVVSVTGEPDADRTIELVGRGEPAVELELSRRGAKIGDAELAGVQLTGRANEATRSVAFHLRAQARVERAGARLRFLSGSAALSGQPAGDGWHAELTGEEDAPGYDLVFDRKGVVPIELDFAAAIREQGDWRRLDFRLMGSAVLPVALTGLAEGIEFDPAAQVVLARSGAEWRGFLPADGAGGVAWRRTRDTSEGALFFSSTELSDIRVAAGVLRQESQITLRILQGRLATLRLRVEGPGEIVGIEGTNVLGWQLIPAGEGRVIEVRLSRPIETEGEFLVRSQAVLGAFPLRAEPLRLVPEGGVRHSGFVRVANAGAVRVEVTEVQGMMQLAPAQFPGGAVEAGARQVFVYRFPAAARGFQVLASQILPEVGVSELTTYEVADTDRVIESDIELDVREAPLCDWTINAPGDYAVAAVSGADVTDYAVESPAADGTRALKVFFGRPVSGRELLHVRLEQNQAASAGEWRLPRLRFPGAKSVRGHVGVVSVPGYRIVPAALERLTEVPLSLFPKQVKGLQQAYRVREPEWTAAVRIEALGQSVQADVYHLYTLRQAAVNASVLVNYFVVGAPANEWRIEVPAAAGNIDVTGQGVRRDWRREGNVIVVSLHQPVLGASTLLVTFEQPMSARGGVVHPGEVRPLGVQAERGFVQLVSPFEVRTDVQKTEGNLLQLEPLELPAELRLLTTAPSLGVFQYTARPFALEVAVNWYAPGETADQVVDFAQFSSQVARDGQVVTEARLFVKTRGRKVLRLQLPSGAKLWETRVDGELVTARADGATTLVPLAARLNPNEPVAVTLRLGQPAGGSPRRVTLSAPKMGIPVVIGEWRVRADPERLLVPRGGTAQVLRPNLTETGFEWLGGHAHAPVVAVVLLIGLAALALRTDARAGGVWALLSALFALFLCVDLARDAVLDRRVNQLDVTYGTTVLPADREMTIELANVAHWQALLSPWGLAAVIVGLGCGVLATRRAGLFRGRILAALGIVLIGAGLLAQRGGAAWFFAATAVAVVWRAAWPAVQALRTTWRNRKRGPGSAPATQAAVSIIALGLLGLALPGGTPTLRAESAPAVVTRSPGAIEAMTQRWDVRERRLYGEINLVVRGAPGDSFVLLHAPAVLTEFVGDGLRVTKVSADDDVQYRVTPDRPGTLTARARFELAVSDVTKGLPVLTGPAAVQRIVVQLDQGGWEFSSPRAVEVQPATGLGENRSGATLVLGPKGKDVINLTPQRRDLTAETTQFIAEVETLYVPGPGAINAYAHVGIRPVQGRVSALDIRIPEGLSVGDVGRGPVGPWRFDPQAHNLHVAIEPARADAFGLEIELQQGAGALPFDVTLRPLRVKGAAGDTGTIALAFGGDAQPEAVRPSGLSAVMIEDFARDLVPHGRDGKPLATLQAAYRYNTDAAALALRVAPVAPEVRVTTRQLLSFGDDRIVLAADLAASITRVGLFQLSFVLPAGLELEAASGPALSHWTQTTEAGRQVVTLHLNGRTLGDQAFALTLVGPVPPASSAWQVPQLTLREATRQTGELQIVPERGVRLQPAARHNVSELDPRTVGNTRSGALAFRLLDQDWSLALAIEPLDPWVTVQALEEVTTREGQTLTRLALRYRIENAAVKQLRLRLPGLDDAQARTVRATGPAVRDFVRVPGDTDAWDLRFQRGVIGETAVQIEYQGPAPADSGRHAILPPVFEGVRQVVQFVAIRAGGRLEVDAPEVPRGWQRVDWAMVPVNLQDRADRSVPALAFRVAEPEAPLALTVRRHGVAEAVKLRVTSASLRTIFSPAGSTLTAVDLQLEVAEKSTLRVRLPEAATLFNTVLNGEGVPVVREGDAFLFHVVPNTAADRTARVRLVYAVTPPRAGEIALRGPRLNVPLEHVTWRVVVPAGFDVVSYRGGLRLQTEGLGTGFGLPDYEALIVAKRAADARQATEFLQTASSLLQNGKQQQAGEVLTRAANASSLDAASNEDARVQLRELRTQQTVIGLNTRRQRLYLDSGADAVRNEQLEQAANLNPLMRGKLDFDPQQVDQLLQGNTVEENAALRGIATRIVDQQLAAQPAPGAIDVTLPERGKVLTFGRTLQVEGDAPLELRFALARTNGAHPWYALLILAGLGVVAGLVRTKPRA